MKIDLVSSELNLTKSHPVRLSNARGVCIRCVSGTIWITAPDKLADIFLAPGETHRIDSHGLVLVESVSDGQVRLEMASKGNALKILLDWLRCASGKRWNTQITATTR
ncbi:MAG: hypothetical protein H6R13_1209 [Proteobacteria bacterium]|nr:hypothetical protein [Pseudomonadota bacterium]